MIVTMHDLCLLTGVTLPVKNELEIKTQSAVDVGLFNQTEMSNVVTYRFLANTLYRSVVGCRVFWVQERSRECDGKVVHADVRKNAKTNKTIRRLGPLHAVHESTRPL